MEGKREGVRRPSASWECSPLFTSLIIIPREELRVCRADSMEAAQKCQVKKTSESQNGATADDVSHHQCDKIFDPHPGLTQVTWVTRSTGRDSVLPR